MLLKVLERIKIVLSGVLLLPHVIFFTFWGEGFKEDLFATCGKSDTMTFLKWIVKKPYIRNLFYLRAGWKFKYFFGWLLKEDMSLHISCKIGKRCHLEHSQNTFLNAKSIGDDFYCLHNVTIGNNGAKDTKPVIGNNVRVFTGAVIVGNIIIGNNVIIAANAVVRSNIPDNCMVAGIPAKIVKHI